MLFCKNLEEIRWRRCGGIARAMADKSMSSKGASVVAETTVVAASKGKIHPIVKYGDPVLERPAATVTKFDAELETLVEDMFASMYAANGVGLAAPPVGKSSRLTVVDVSVGKNSERKIVV